MSKERPWNEGGSEKPYSVSFWMDKPVETDTCWTALDFATEKEARLYLAENPRYEDNPYILLDGPGVHEVIFRPEIMKQIEEERKEEDRAWRREMAMEAGMGLGIDAYNEAMGYEVYCPDDD